MSTLLGRIKFLVDALTGGPRHGNLKNFTDLTGIKYETLRGWLNKGINSLTYDHSKAIYNAIGVSEEWLNTGRIPDNATIFAERLSILIYEHYSGDVDMFASAMGIAPAIAEAFLAKTCYPSSKIIKKIVALSQTTREWLTGDDDGLQAVGERPTESETEDMIANILSRGSQEISDEFRRQAAEELKRILSEKRKLK